MLYKVFKDFMSPKNWTKDHKNHFVTTRAIFISFDHNEEKFIITSRDNTITIPAKDFHKELKE